MQTPAEAPGPLKLEEPNDLHISSFSSEIMPTIVIWKLMPLAILKLQ